MTHRKSLEIIIGKTDLWPASYYLAHLVEIWRREGINIHVTSTPSDQGFNISFMHVDLTRLPNKYRNFANHYGYCINGNIVDISKSSYSLDLIKRSSGWEGPVIVKTDLNYGGLPERKLRYRQFGGYLIKKLIRYNPWHYTKRFKPPNYPIFKNKNEVPAWVWRNRNLIVERFVPEMVDNLYAIRYWIFLGDCEYMVRFCSPDPIVKARNAIRREVLSEIPETLRKKREELQMDYGKFDFVMNQGKAILLDINKTPSYRPFEPGQPPGKEAHLLAQGLHSLAWR